MRRLLGTFGVLVTVLLGSVAIAAVGASSAQAHTSPEYYFDGFITTENVLGPGHRHRLWESTARATGGGVVCAGALNDDGSSILQARFCSYDLSVQPLNGTSWRRGITATGGSISTPFWVRAREAFGND